MIGSGCHENVPGQLSIEATKVLWKAERIKEKLGNIK
jgi:hypothetical protein